MAKRSALQRIDDHEKLCRIMQKQTFMIIKVDGLGYEESKQQEEPKGKYKSSGYGDLKENKMDSLNNFRKFLNETVEEKEVIKDEVITENVNSDDLKELLEEAVAGIPSLGNPFFERPKQAYENKFLSFLNEEKEEVEEGEAAYEYEKGKEAGEAEEKKEVKKEGRMKMSEVLKEAERLGELAKKQVEAKVYEKAIAERKTAMSINEDESLSEFINQEAIKEVEKEIKELEKKLMEVTADKNTMTGGK